jgi:hypothetical protein
MMRTDFACLTQLEGNEAQISKMPSSVDTVPHGVFEVQMLRAEQDPECIDVLHQTDTLRLTIQIFNPRSKHG